jgi:hypothetical protein
VIKKEGEIQWSDSFMIYHFILNWFIKLQLPAYISSSVTLKIMISTAGNSPLIKFVVWRETTP